MMNYEEFLRPKDESEIREPSIAETAEVREAEGINEENVSSEQEGVELDVQKAVVESLAADKAALDEDRSKLQAEVSQLQVEVARLQGEIIRLQREQVESKRRCTELERALAAEQEKLFDQQERNPNALALLDREIELPDRFPGETRDHVLEVLREARDASEKDGRSRRAQILEAVLVANEPNGMLEKKREKLVRVFEENGNIISGPVIDFLQKEGLSHKDGENYLLVPEIIKRSY